MHDDLFDIIQSNHKDRNILWRFISNEPKEDESQSEATEIHNDKIQNKKRSANKYSTNHTIQRKRQKPGDYKKDSFDDFKVIIVDPPPEWNSDESDILSICYGQSMENKSNEVIYKMVLTHLLNLRLSRIPDPLQ